MFTDRDDNAMAPTKHCPSCRKLSVVFDFLQGLYVCEDCGRVLQDTELVHTIFVGDDTNRTTGVFVGPQDSGLRASLRHIDSTVAHTMQRYRPHEATKKFLDSLRILANQLQLPPEIAQQAASYLERLVPLASGGWRRELLSAAAAYAAIRQNALPLTLLDLSNVTQIDIYTLGHCYHHANTLLNIQPPRIRPQLLLPRCIHKVLVGEVLPSKVNTSVHDDAMMVIDWMDYHDIGTRYPMTAVAAAIVFALDMNNVW